MNFGAFFNGLEVNFVVKHNNFADALELSFLVKHNGRENINISYSNRNLQLKGNLGDYTNGVNFVFGHNFNSKRIWWDYGF